VYCCVIKAGAPGRTWLVIAWEGGGPEAVLSARDQRGISKLALMWCLGFILLVESLCTPGKPVKAASSIPHTLTANPSWGWHAQSALLLRLLCVSFMGQRGWERGGGIFFYMAPVLLAAHHL